MHPHDRFKKFCKQSLTTLLLIFAGSLLTNTVSFAADPRDVTVTLSIWDNLSGVTMMQIAEDKNNPPPAVAYETTTVIHTAADVLYVRIQDRAQNWSAWVTLVVGGAPVIQTPPQPSAPSAPITSSSSSAAAAPAAGGGGGGGGGVGTTWFNLFLSNPDEPTQPYPGEGCAVFIHHLKEGDKQFGPICATRAGALDFEANDGDFTIKVFDKSRPNVTKDYTGKITFGTFEVVGAGYRGGSVPRRVITGPRASDVAPTPLPTPTPTPSPTQTPSPSATAKPVATQSATPVVTATPVPIASTPPPIPANPFFAQVAPGNIAKAAIKPNTTVLAQSIKKPLQLVLPASKATEDIAVFIKLPTGKSMTVLRATPVQGAATVAPPIKFKKAGTYTFTIQQGKTKKTFKVTVK